MTEEASPAENSGRSPADLREDGLPVGRPFRRGALSPNPGGRPKGLPRRIREMFGDEGEALLGYAATVMSGYARLVDPDTGEVTHEKCSVADRNAMLKILLDRGWGRVREYPPIEDADDALGFDDVSQRLADGFEKAMDELAERRQARQAEAAEG